MITYAALLRGINVGGHKKIAMADLLDLIGRCGYLNPRSVLQSGNLVFGGEAKSGSLIERTLESEAASRLGLETEFFVRSAAEWVSVIADNPFPKEAKTDPSHLVVMFLKSSPQAKDVDALRTFITGPELVHSVGKQLYLTYPEGIGRSRLTNTLIERKLGTRGTARNWNTVLKIGNLAGLK
jgi:uncharacterized protein (DUF1697 family)